MVDTVARRSAGDDQRHRERHLDAPQPLAAGVAQAVGRLEDVGATESKPAAMLRTKMTSVYMTSGITTVSSEMPVTEMSAANIARLGIV